MCTISWHKFKRHYLKDKRLFLDFLFRFWNVHEFWKPFQEKDEYRTLIFSEIINSERSGYLNL